MTHIPYNQRYLDSCYELYITSSLADLLSSKWRRVYSDEIRFLGIPDNLEPIEDPDEVIWNPELIDHCKRVLEYSISRQFPAEYDDDTREYKLLVEDAPQDRADVLNAIYVKATLSPYIHEYDDEMEPYFGIGIRDHGNVLRNALALGEREKFIRDEMRRTGSPRETVEAAIPRDRLW